MPTFKFAKFDPDTKVVQYLTDDNRICIRSGGTLPWRTNNAGDLLAPLNEAGQPAPKVTVGWLNLAFAKEGHYFFIFPDYDSGRKALHACLLRVHKQKNFAQFVHSYAPGKDGNKEGDYVSQLVTYTGLDPSRTIGSLSDGELNSFMDAIERVEGYHNEEGTRKETYVAVSTIHATDGRVPVAGEQIVVKSADGSECTFTSDAYGVFPPIVHDNGPTTIVHKTADGGKKTVGVLPPEGKHYSLLTKVSEYVGWSAPKKAPEKPVDKKKTFNYTVQPGDTLGKIAARFNTSVAQIKADNHLSSDKIFPGQCFGIYGQAQMPAAPNAPKMAAPKKRKPATNATSTEKAAPAPAPETQTAAARSKDGGGEPLALIPPEDGAVPWMKHALEEAKRFHGQKEGDIEKTMNYHTAVHDYMKSMVGDTNAWCAAFANYCLQAAKYPIYVPEGFADPRGEVGRAEGFRHAHVKSGGAVTNPLYTKIDDPIYGAIAILVKKSNGVGEHAAFVYGRISADTLCLLGGNQGDMIRFSPFLEDANIPVVTDKKTGKPKKAKSVSFTIEFYLPTSYMPYYEKSEKKLDQVNCNELNKALGNSEDDSGSTR